LWQRALGLTGEERHDISTVNDWIMAFGGHQYPLGLPQTIRGDKEPPPTTFEAYAVQMFGANPVVWSAVQARKAVFSQGRFQLRRKRNGELWGGERELGLLERPWTGGTTKKLLTRSLLHADIGGNAYGLSIPGRARPRIQLMRPDYVTIVMGSELEPDEPSLAEDAELVGYMYAPPGIKPRFYFADEVGHFAPMPDPLATFRGMSWFTSVVREVLGDKQATEHKLKFFEQGATPNLIIRFDTSQTLSQVKAFKELVEEDHQGLADAYRTMYLGGGADATIVGKDLQQTDFAAIMGKAETRILMAAGVHPVIAGASEGMQGASLNAGNFVAIRRLFSDVHLQDLWGDVAAAFSTLVKVPSDSDLVIDDRHIPFLQDDAKDDAEISFTRARAITLYVREGFTEESAKLAVTTGDESVLKHTGLMSVQLQAPVDPNAADLADTGTQNQDGTDNLDGTDDTTDPADRALDRAKRIGEVSQKTYLAVGVQFTAEENRQLLRDAGWSELSEELPDELKPKEPATEPTDPAADPAADDPNDSANDGEDQGNGDS
jgi:hypothetical protein